MWDGLERALLFPTYLVSAPGAPTLPPDAERWWRRADNASVEAWYLPSTAGGPREPGPAVIFAHGNGEVIDDWPALLAPYRALGFAVLLPEYRGYGRSTGRPGMHTITADLIHFHDQLAARGEIDARRIVLHGRSLGGGAVCALGAARRPRALVLMSTFTSVSDVARRWLVPKALLQHDFDNLSFVRKRRAPLCVVHGRRDTLIPPRHATRLATEGGAERLVWFEAGHNDCPSDWPRFWAELEAFFRATGVLPDRAQKQ